MHATTTSCLIFLAAALTAAGIPSLPAQNERDALSAVPQALVFAGPGSEILVKAAGDQNSPPMPLANLADHVPDFRLSTIFGVHAPDLEVDALSTGNDLLPLFDQGDGTYAIVQQGSLAWAALMVSVPDGTASDPGTPLASRGSGHGSDIFNYWFPGNSTVPVEFDDAAFLVAGHEHLQVPAEHELVAFDAFLPVVVDLVTNGEEDPWVATTNRLFFSLTAASASHIRDNWTTAVTAPSPTSSLFEQLAMGDVTAATVFEVEWSNTAPAGQPPAYGWSGIRAHRLPSDLGLTPDDDIDGLAFWFANEQHPILFSLKNGSPTLLTTDGFENEQLFASQPGAGPLPVRANIQNPDGRRRVQRQIGIRNGGDIDAVCGVDPENTPGRSIAQPIGGGTTQFGIGLSAARTIVNGEVVLRLQATNVPANYGVVSFYLNTSSGPILLEDVANAGTSVVRFDSRFPYGNGSEMHFQAVFTDRAYLSRISWPVEIKL